MTVWEKLCEGYGIQKVPRSLLGHLQCQMCEEKRHLYTTERLTPKDTASPLAWRRLGDNLVQKVYCRFHTIWLYKEQ